MCVCVTRGVFPEVPTVDARLPIPVISCPSLISATQGNSLILRFLLKSNRWFLPESSGDEQENVLRNYSANRFSPNEVMKRNPEAGKLVFFILHPCAMCFPSVHQRDRGKQIKQLLLNTHMGSRCAQEQTGSANEMSAQHSSLSLSGPCVFRAEGSLVQGSSGVRLMRVTDRVHTLSSTILNADSSGWL